MTANPVGFCYSSTKGVAENAAPGWLFIPDQHRDDPVYAQAQAKGAEVSPYLNMAEDKIRGAKDEEFRAFVGDSAKPWGNSRASWYPLLDIRVGREYVRRTVDYIAEKIMPRFDGITLDVNGGQLHSKADWANWPAAEKREWQDGNVDFMRLLDERRRAIKPWFKIQTINIWHEDKRGLDYVDGFCIELHEPTAFWRGVAGQPCGYLGQRRVIAIARTVEDAKTFAEVPGITHVTATPVKPYYAAMAPAVVQPQDNRLAEAQAMREWLQTQRSNGDIVTQAQVSSLKEQLAGAVTKMLKALDSLDEAKETIRLLGERVDFLTTKVRAMAAFNAEQAEGVE